MPARLTTLLLIALLPFFAACEGSAGPTGPAGPQGPAGPAGPQGPAGAGVNYQVFEGPITNTTMTTTTVFTSGVEPGVVCYLNSNSTPTVWAVVALNTGDDLACGVVEDGSGYFGSSSFDASLVNAGWNVRIILFWLEG